MIDALIAILKGSNSDARKLSLACLGTLYKLSYNTNSDVIDLSLTIEESKPSLESAKPMAMYIRRLGSSYPTIPRDSWVSRLIPYHLFGMAVSNTGISHTLTITRTSNYAILPHMERCY